MKSIKKVVFFMLSFIIHLELLLVFSLNLYFLYFFNLVVVGYLLSKKYNHFSLGFFLSGILIVLFIINQNYYQELIFDWYLYLNIIDKMPYINSEVMYALSTLHLLVLIILKKFENFWDIIDKKLLGWY